MDETREERDAALEQAQDNASHAEAEAFFLQKDLDAARALLSKALPIVESARFPGPALSDGQVRAEALIKDIKRALSPPSPAAPGRAFLVSLVDDNSDAEPLRVFTARDGAKRWLALAPACRYQITECPLDDHGAPPLAAGWMVRISEDRTDAQLVERGGVGPARFPTIGIEVPFLTPPPNSFWTFFFTSPGDVQKTAKAVTEAAESWLPKHRLGLESTPGYYHPATGALLEDVTSRCETCKTPLALGQRSFKACPEHRCQKRTGYGQCWEAAGHTHFGTDPVTGGVYHRVGNALNLAID